MSNRRTRSRLLVVAALAWSSVAFPQEQQQQHQQQSRQPQQQSPPPASPAAEEFVARIEIGLRYRIAQDEYQWLTDLVPKDTHDPAVVKERINALEQEMRRAYERRLEPLLNRSAECAVGRGPHESAEAALAFKALVDDRNRATAAFDALERDAIVLLCDTLELDEPTRAEIDCERLVRLRGHLGTHACDLLPAQVDLEPLLRQQLAGVAPSTDACLRAALRGYADEMYNLRAQHARMRLRDGAEDALEFTVGGADATTLVESRRRRNAPRVRVERLMIESNREWVQRIAECLAPDGRAALLDRWRSRSFPLVYPNPYDLRGLIAAIGGGEGVDAKSKEQLLPALGGLQERIDEASRRMEEACLDSWTAWAMTHAKHPTREAEALAEALRVLDRQRREGAAEAVALIGDDGAVRALAGFAEVVARVSAVESATAP